MFKATITGYLGRDPEQRTFNDQTVTRFSVGVRTVKKDKETGQNTTDWVEVSIWGKRGDYWNQNLRKGSKVVISGDLSHGSFVGKDGVTKNTIELNCSDIEHMAPRDPQSADAPAQAPAAGGFTETPEDELPFD